MEQPPVEWTHEHEQVLWILNGMDGIWDCPPDDLKAISTYVEQQGGVHTELAQSLLDGLLVQHEGRAADVWQDLYEHTMAYGHLWTALEGPAYSGPAYADPAGDAPEATDRAQEGQGANDGRGPEPKAAPTRPGSALQLVVKGWSADDVVLDDVPRSHFEECVGAQLGSRTFNLDIAGVGAVPVARANRAVLRLRPYDGDRTMQLLEEFLAGTRGRFQYAGFAGRLVLESDSDLWNTLVAWGERNGACQKQVVHRDGELLRTADPALFAALLGDVGSPLAEKILETHVLATPLGGSGGAAPLHPGRANVFGHGCTTTSDVLVPAGKEVYVYADDGAVLNDNEMYRIIEEGDTSTARRLCEGQSLMNTLLAPQTADRVEYDTPYVLRAEGNPYVIGGNLDCASLCSSPEACWEYARGQGVHAHRPDCTGLLNVVHEGSIHLFVCQNRHDGPLLSSAYNHAQQEYDDRITSAARLFVQENGHNPLLAGVKLAVMHATARGALFAADARLTVLGPRPCLDRCTLADVREALEHFEQMEPAEQLRVLDVPGWHGLIRWNTGTCVKYRDGFATFLRTVVKFLGTEESAGDVVKSCRFLLDDLEDYIPVRVDTLDDAIGAAVDLTIACPARDRALRKTAGILLAKLRQLKANLTQMGAVRAE
ncbi:hypothetical protein [Streptomyces sp. NPDC059918]|uniref:hypothetical protein n=1 Tax=unclassified Streptomyces TaxID=2593676 RepID=UPI0036670CB1